MLLHYVGNKGKKLQTTCHEHGSFACADRRVTFGMAERLVRNVARMIPGDADGIFWPLRTC